MNIEHLLKALANPRRLAILKMLSERKESSVTKIARRINLSVRSTSKHLLLLRRAEVLERRQISLVAWYRLAPGVHDIVRVVLKHLS